MNTLSASRQLQRILTKESLGSWPARISKEIVLKTLLTILAGLIICTGYFILFPNKALGVDWYDTFYPATHLFLTGANPYLITTLHNPLWLLFLLAPFALLGPQLGGHALAIFMIGAFAFVAHKLGAKYLALFLFLLSPLTLWSLGILNVDIFVMLGFFMPPALGLFFVLIKPQAGIGIVLFWLWQAFKTGGVRKLIATLIPVTAALLITFLFYGNWLTGKTDHILVATWNMSIWPWGLLVGAALMLYSIRSRRVSSAIAASPFLSPYVALQSWVVVLATCLENDLLMIIITGASWIIFLSGILFTR
jgi:hypothetical protein